MIYYHLILRTLDDITILEGQDNTGIACEVAHICKRKAWDFRCAKSDINHLHVLIGLPSEYWVPKLVQKLKTKITLTSPTSNGSKFLKCWHKGYHYTIIPIEELSTAYNKIVALC